MTQRFWKKWGLFLLACILDVVVCVLFYFIEYVAYQDAIPTPFLYVVVFPVFILLAWGLNGGYRRTAREKEQEELMASGILTKYEEDDACRKQKLRLRNPYRALVEFTSEEGAPSGRLLLVFVTAVILIAATIFMVYILITDPYTLVAYYYFAILLILLFFSLLDTDRILKLSVPVCLIYTAMILITGLYLLIVSPMTTAMAEQLLEEEGYENIYYEKLLTDEDMFLVIYDEEPELLSDQADGLGFYMFRCERDGVAMGVAVSVTDHNIVAAEPLANNSGLNFYMNFD